MNLEEIKAAVRAGKTVHWVNANYRVVSHSPAEWLIAYTPEKGNFIGLPHRDGVTLNGTEDQFYIAEEPEDVKASETGRRPRHPGVAQYEGSTGKDWRTGKKLSHTELAARAEADELLQAETGRMEFPALVIHTVKGEPVSCDIVRSDSDSWIGSYPVEKQYVIPLSTILRAQAMERALEDCQTPEDDSAFMDDNGGERARAHLRSINRIARHALKGTVTA